MQIEKVKKILSEYGFKMTESNGRIVAKRGTVKAELKNIDGSWFIKMFGLCLSFYSIKEFDAYDIESVILNSNFRILNAR